MATTNSEHKMNGAFIENNEKINQLISNASELSDKAVDISKDAVDKSITFAKEYPIHTAIGAGVLGFISGILVKKILK